MSYFDEVDYLLRNPDVRAVVGGGRFPCGEHHYNAHGRPEGRPGRRVALPPRAAYLVRRLTSTATAVKPESNHWSGINVRWWRSAGAAALPAHAARPAGQLSVRVLSVSWKGIQTVRRKTVPLADVDDRYPLNIYWPPIEESAGQRYFVVIRQSGAPGPLSGSAPFVIAEEDEDDGGLIYSNPEPLETFPVALLVSAVTQCNLNCIHCISRHSRQHGVNVMEDKVWAQVEAAAKAGHLEHVRSDYSGDLLNNDRRHGGWLDRIIGLDLPFEMDTHANDLTAEVAEKLIGSKLRSINFSLDTMDPVDYPKIRRGAKPHADVVANIRHFMALRNAHRPDIQTILSFVLMRRNIETIADALDMVKELQMSFACGNHVHAYTKDMVEESLMLVPHRYAEICERLRGLARDKGVKLTLPEPVFLTAARRGHLPCSLPRRSPLLLGNGDVMACCVPGTKVGNMSEGSLEEIWNGDAMRSFRARVNSDDPPAACDVCPIRRETGNLASFVPGLDEAGRRDFETRCLEAVRTGA